MHLKKTQQKLFLLNGFMDFSALNAVLAMSFACPK